MPSSTARLLLTGDVMTGRGIDQILPQPCDPALYESYTSSALDYVALAEQAHGPIPRRVPYSYVWGDALGEIARRRSDFHLINLETALTTDGMAEPKGINYRMHPANIGVLSAAHIDGCVLANNHILDWGVAGLSDTLEALRQAGIAAVGAGCNAVEASAPLVHPLPGGGRILVFAFGCRDSGILSTWRAAENRAGVNLLDDLSRATVAGIADLVKVAKQPGDIVIASIHWGGNWGYEIGDAERTFAHLLIDDAAVDMVHGHSSHHPKGIEVWHGKLVLYGCGDLINDYEGITGYEEYRDDLVLMYFPVVRINDGMLQALEMVPFRIRAFRLEHAPAEDVAWLTAMLSQEGRQFGTWIELAGDGHLLLRWPCHGPGRPGSC